MSISIRAASLASWGAAQKRATVTGDLVLNAPTAAGMILMVHGGDVVAAAMEARARIPYAGYWIRVTWMLEQIQLEEEAEAAGLAAAGE